jgi:hypothetical protein
MLKYVGSKTGVKHKPLELEGSGLPQHVQKLIFCLNLAFLLFVDSFYERTCGLHLSLTAADRRSLTGQCCTNFMGSSRKPTTPQKSRDSNRALDVNVEFGGS